jgi:hypothetical protein
LYDIANQMGIAIVSTVTAGIASFLLNKLWKCIKARRNTSDDAAPPPGGTPEFITPPSSPPSEEIALSVSSSPRSSTPTGPTE